MVHHRLSVGDPVCGRQGFPGGAAGNQRAFQTVRYSGGHEGYADGAEDSGNSQQDGKEEAVRRIELRYLRVRYLSGESHRHLSGQGGNRNVLAVLEGKGGKLLQHHL